MILELAADVAVVADRHELMHGNILRDGDVGLDANVTPSSDPTPIVIRSASLQSWATSSGRTRGIGCRCRSG